MLDVTVVVPTRNAERILPACLSSIAAAEPEQLIVVDGRSDDATRQIASEFTDEILDDGGAGLPVARLLGAEAARCHTVALIDADVVVPEGALAALLEEFRASALIALQAGLHSVGGPHYWGRALAHHHRTGRSRWWFGLVATVLERETLLRVGFDPRFTSGEDIEIRTRLQRAGAAVGVSRTTLVIHRFADDGFAFAREQWLADGAGLARSVRKFGGFQWGLVALPLIGSARGTMLSLATRQPQWVPYYGLYAAYNYLGMVHALRADTWGADVVEAVAAP